MLAGSHELEHTAQEASASTCEFGSGVHSWSESPDLSELPTTLSFPSRTALKANESN